MKVVINKKYGGFGLSYKAVKRYFELQGWNFIAVTEQKHQADDWDVSWLNLPFVPAEENNPCAITYYFRNHVPVRRNYDDNSLSVIDQNRAEDESWDEAGYWSDREVDRADPILVQVVEELGDLAAGAHAGLKIVEIPDDIQYTIEEYDGKEWVAQVHETWG